MARLYYGHVITNGAKIHYYRTGDEKPPVIFLHGLAENGLCWSRLALRLEPFYDVILVDSRSHGLSEATKDGYSPEDRAADIAGLIESLHLEKPQIVGHSMGAETAIMSAALYPKMIGGLILEDAPLWDHAKKETPEARANRAMKISEETRSYREATLHEIIEIGKRMHPRWHETDLFQWAKAKQQVKPQAFQAITLDRKPWREYAKLVKNPVLLITGDTRLGAIITPETAAELKKMWRKMQHINIPHAGHNIRRDQFEIYLDTVKVFLRKQTRW